MVHARQSECWSSPVHGDKSNVSVLFQQKHHLYIRDGESGPDYLPVLKDTALGTYQSGYQSDPAVHDKSSGSVTVANRGTLNIPETQDRTLDTSHFSGISGSAPGFHYSGMAIAANRTVTRVPGTRKLS